MYHGSLLTQYGEEQARETAAQAVKGLRQSPQHHVQHMRKDEEEENHQHYIPLYDLGTVLQHHLKL